MVQVDGSWDSFLFIKDMTKWIIQEKWSHRDWLKLHLTLTAIEWGDYVGKAEKRSVGKEEGVQQTLSMFLQEGLFFLSISNKIFFNQ